MTEATAKLLAEKAGEIAKQTAESLKLFTRETATLLYAKQMVEAKLDAKIAFPDGTIHKKMDNKDANEKMNKMLDEAKLKWKYADDSSKKKVAQMEKIVLDGQEKIRTIYKVETDKLIANSK